MQEPPISKHVFTAWMVHDFSQPHPVSQFVPQSTPCQHSLRLLGCSSLTMYCHYEIVSDSFQLKEIIDAVFEVGCTWVDCVENGDGVCVAVSTEQMHRFTIVLKRRT
jgi:hypothetical protein